MDQEVRVYDRWGNLKEVISDEKAREKSEKNFINYVHSTHNYKIAVERKCWCGVTFTTKKKRQVNCNTEECFKKKRQLRREAKKKKREKEAVLSIISFFYLFPGLSLFP